MKKLICFVFVALICVFNLKAKEEPGTPLVCDTVIQVPGKSADQLFKIVKSWFPNNAPSYVNFERFSNEQNQMIIDNCIIDFEVINLTWHSLTGRINYKTEVAVRDGRVRLKMFDFYHSSRNEGWSEGLIYMNGPNPDIKGLRKKQNSEMQKRANKILIPLIESYKKSLSEAVTSNNMFEDDW